MAQLAHQAVGGALQRRPGDNRRHRHRVLTHGPDGVGDTGHGQQRPDGHDRVRRSHHDHLGPGNGIEHPRPRRRGLGTIKAHRRDRQIVAQPHEVLLEADLVAVGQGHHRGHPVLGHGKQRRLEAPPGGDARRYLGKAHTSGQVAGAVEVGAQVEVAQVEPRVTAVAAQRTHCLPRLACETPTGLGVVGPGERVGDRVQVRGDVQPVHDHVVAGVHHSGHLSRRHHLHQPRQKPGGTDPAGQHGYQRRLLTPESGVHPRGGPGRRRPSSPPGR